MQSRQNLKAITHGGNALYYEGVKDLEWGETEITFSHDSGYTILNRVEFLGTTLTTETVQ